MLLNKVVVAAAAFSLTATACPYMDPNKRDQHARQGEILKQVVEKRNAQNDNNNDGDTPPVLIGDLATIGATTSVGKTIQGILLGTEGALTSEAGYFAPPLGTSACKADTCCVWSHVANFLTLQFRGPTGRCNKDARAAIRLGFHDAGTWSVQLAAAGQDFGGADGSIALAPGEIQRAENNGLQDIVHKMIDWQNLFKVGMADLIQFAAIHAVVTCPLGPRIRFFAGRQDSSRPAPDGLLPSAASDAQTLLNLFRDKTISPHNLAALVGAHTTSEQFHFDLSKVGKSQDSTPGVWDVRFYNETVGTPPPEVFRFPSDMNLAVHPQVSPEWTKFRAPDGQDHWNGDYAAAYTRLSLLGVNNINQLTECSKVLPLARPSFPGASLRFLDQ